MSGKTSVIADATASTISQTVTLTELPSITIITSDLVYTCLLQLTLKILLCSFRFEPYLIA